MSTQERTDGGHLGHLVREAREHQGLSQDDLAKKAQVSSAVVVALESGHGHVDLRVARNVVDALRYDLGNSAQDSEAWLLVSESSSAERAAVRESTTLIEKGQKLAGHHPSGEALDRARRILSGETAPSAARAELEAKYGHLRAR